MNEPEQRSQREASLAFIEASGGWAVEANVGSKAPMASWSPINNDAAKSERLITKLRGNNSNVGVHLHGDIVDVDIDTDEPLMIAALDMFLPPCSHVWGRDSRKRTHRAYKLNEAFNPDLFPSLVQLKKIAGVEIRGGLPKRGNYSLLPGSVHPDGEIYQWHDLQAARSTMAISTPERLVTAVRHAAAAAAIAAHFTEGVRQELTMCLSGFLHRVHSSQEEGEECHVVMDKARAKQFIKSVCELSNDDKSDLYARTKAFEATWVKADKGVQVVGATRMVAITGDDQLLKFLYTMLSDNVGAQVLDLFLERFAVRLNTVDVVDVDALRSGRSRPSVMSRTAFQASYAHERVTLGGKSVRVVDIFFDLRATKRVAQIDIEPAEPPLFYRGEELIANSWAGFAIPPAPKFDGADPVSMFTDYMREVVADGDEENLHWITSWVSDIFQRPGKRPGTALVLVGAPGAGKSTLGHRILMPIIGKAHSTSTNSVERITKTFNSSFANKLLIQCDEATNNKQKATAAKLKSLITDPTIFIEPKNVNGWDQRNLARFVFTSNELDDALAITDGTADRRYAVYEVSSKRAEDTAYWDRFVAWLGDEANLALVHRYLLDYEYDPSILRRTSKATAAKTRLLEQSMSSFDSWLAFWVGQEHPIAESLHKPWHSTPNDGRVVNRGEWPEHVYTGVLVESYHRHSSMRGGVSDIRNAQQMLTALSRVPSLREGPRILRPRVTYVDERTQQVMKLRPKLHLMPTMAEVQQYLTSKYGTKWDNEADDTAQAADTSDDEGERLEY